MTSSVGILNQSHDNLEKRIARIESQLGRPRSCKYGTTAERTAYGAPVDGILWWDTTEEVLYVWYNYNWILAKGVMVGGTTAREATSLPTAGGMWWDTDEDNLYVWGISSSWQSVTGAKFGTREQRDAGGFGGAVWICSDEGYAYSYDDSAGNWRAIGDSVVDLNWLYQYGGHFAMMGHRTDYSPTSSYDQKDVHKVGTGAYLTETGPVEYGQEGLVPYADFSNGTTTWGYGGGGVVCALAPAGTLHVGVGNYTIMIWFKISEFSSYPQPIIGTTRGTLMYWLLHIGGTWHNWNSYYSSAPRKLIFTDHQIGTFPVSLDTWHFAAVRNGYLSMDGLGWTSSAATVNFEDPWGYVNDKSGSVSHATFTYVHQTVQLYLHGRVSMYYMNGNVGLTEGQIDMFYERTRRLHGV